MDFTYFFEQLDDILAGLTIIGIIFSLIMGFYKIIVPFYKKQLERRIIIDSFIKELGNEAPSIIKNNLKNLTFAIDKVAAKVEIIAQRTKIGIYLCDENGKCIWVNKPLAEMFNIDQKNMSGYGWLQNVCDKESAYTHWKWSVENNIPYKDLYEVETKDGVKNYLSEAYKHTSEDQNGTVFYIGFVEEIRE